MKESITAGIAVLALALCCALPLLILSGVFVTGGGVLLDQPVLLALGVMLVILAGLSWLAFHKRTR